MKRELLPILLIVSLFWMPSLASAQSTDSLQSLLELENLDSLADEAQRFGDPARGAFVFYRPEMNCARCHELGANNRRLGPELSEKREVKYRHLIESILFPGREIKNGFETILVRDLDGEIISGVLIENRDDRIVLDRIEETDQPLTIAKDDIDEWKLSEQSSMPEQLANQLTDRQEFLDLVAYLFEISKGESRAEQLRPDSSYFATAPLPEYESRVDHRKLIEAWDRKSRERGAEIYRLRCESCHGTLDQQGSMPTSLRFATGKFKRGGDPLSMYQTLTHGYGMMNSQRWMVPKQKYDVIHFIREHFVKPQNPQQYTVVNERYLASLPSGDTVGPEPKINRPWSDMDYGPSLNNTVEVSRDGSNIAQKGIVIRLDGGPGGVESGKYWMMYDHDTMRVAGAWSGGFIDYNGIHFNGVHGQHPKTAGSNWIQNPVGPGWADPANQSFEDERLEGRDGRKYGPLPKNWLSFKGLYRFGQRTLLKYAIGNREIVESPTLNYFDGRPMMIRQFNVGPGESDVVVQVLRTSQKQDFVSADDSTLVFQNEQDSPPPVKGGLDAFDFDGEGYAQSKDRLDMTKSDFTVYAEIKSGEDGTIFSQTRDRRQWIKDGKTFFIRDGRLHYDIGWVGELHSDVHVDGDRWRKVALVWQADSGTTAFFVDDSLQVAGQIQPEGQLKKPVQRIGFTNQNFPSPSPFVGQIRNVRFYSRCLSEKELCEIEDVSADLQAVWNSPTDGLAWKKTGQSGAVSPQLPGLLVSTTLENQFFAWETTASGDLRMRIKAHDSQLKFALAFHASEKSIDVKDWQSRLEKLAAEPKPNLFPMLNGGPANWPQVLETNVNFGEQHRGFQVDVLTRPVQNPWNDRMRLTGIDFIDQGKNAIVSCWDGSVYRVSGIDEESTDQNAKITWRRIAAGLFQPLGVRVVDGEIFVTCRDQLVRLHDLNGDGEMDWYENFNSDHQVTEHFHEFAMGLQTDDEGNFYYAKSARHALKAVVPHHGTLLKVSRDGASTEIVANGFRAANGVCLNPDGSFIVTDQEGHWNPKNRINWVRSGGFYGNMFGYHDVTDSSDEAMDPPLCWITNAFDRSPGELLWVTSDRWKNLKGSLLNLSYGTGQIFIVPHEKLADQVQGGMCAFPMKRFPTGIMRGRFSPSDGQLYCCGMFAWAGDQQQPGGFYRVRYLDQPAHLPVDLQCTQGQVRLTFSDAIEAESGSDSRNFRVETWGLKRTRNYGSKHYDQKRIEVTKTRLLDDDRTVVMTIPELEPTWCMKIQYSVRDLNGQKISGEIHNTIHALPNK